MKLYLVVDLEATCCDDGSIPTSEQETIEIGAVIVDGVCPELLGMYSSFVKPTRHPVLTEFCQKLTGIKQSDVDGADRFPAAFRKFLDWMGELDGGHQFCSWGNFDRDQFNRDCSYWWLPCALDNLGNHLDIAWLFKRKTGRKRGRRGAMKYLGLVPEGPNHRGLSDAKDGAAILSSLLG